MKNFGLAGRNKAMKHEESPTSMGLVEMSAWPDEEWHNQKVSGKELSKGLSGGALSKLEKALKLEPGPVPKNDEWENILGHETRKGPAIEGKAKQPIQPTIKAPKVNGQMNGVATAAVSEKGVARPQRAKKRTRYDDASFEGYGEGFVDDDRDDDDGYTSNEGSKRSSGSRKKRRKVSSILKELYCLGHVIKMDTNLLPSVWNLQQCRNHVRTRSGQLRRWWHDAARRQRNRCLWRQMTKTTQLLRELQIPSYYMLRPLEGTNQQ